MFFKIKGLISVSHDEEILSFLDTNDSKIDDKIYYSLLAYAIQKRKIKILDVILQKFLENKCTIDINSPLYNGLNALALSIMYNEPEIFNKMLLVGASPIATIGRNISNMSADLRKMTLNCQTRGMTPLSVAVDLNRMDMVRSLKPLVGKSECLNQVIRLSIKPETKGMIDLLLSDCDDLIKETLIQSIKENNALLTSSLLNLGRLDNLDFVVANTSTPLIEAVKHKSYDSFDVLKNMIKDKKIKANVDLVVSKTNPLNEACIINDTYFVKKLLFMGANPIAELDDGFFENGEKICSQTPLYYLTEKVLKGKDCYSQILSLMLGVFTEDALALPAVQIAKQLKTKKVYSMLLRSKNDLSQTIAFNERLIKAAQKGEADLALFLMERKISPFVDVNGTTAFKEAIKNNQIDVVKVFLQNRSIKQLNNEGKASLHSLTAIYNGYEDIALLMLKSGIKMPYFFENGECVFDRIVDFDMGRLLKEVLIDNPKLIDENFVKKSFWKSILMKRNACALVFVEQGCDVNFQNVKGVSPFLLAVKRKNTPFLKKLHDINVNYNLCDNQGKSALHYAIENKDEKTVFWLIDKGVPVDCADENGVTPLMVAVKNGMQKTAMVLIEFKANPHKRNKEGKSAFDYYQLMRKKNFEKERV